MKAHWKKIVQKLTSESFKDGKLIESKVTKSIKLLKSKPTPEAILALGWYLKGLKIRQRQHTLVIESMIPLSASQLIKIKKLMERKARLAPRLQRRCARAERAKITKVTTKINPEILGGIRLRLGDEVWDLSALGKLTQIKEAIIYGRPD